jgi:MFS family permease
LNASVSGDAAVVGAPVEAIARPTNWSVVADRNYGPYLLGTVASNVGTWFQNIAQSLLIFRMTGSTFLVGVVNFLQFIACFVLAPWAGGFADRFNRRRLMMLTQTACAVITALLALLAGLDAVNVPIVFAVALAVGIATAFSIPSMQALIPLLVSSERLGRAIALQSVAFNLARAIGPLLGVLVIDRLGIPAAFGLNALSYVALVVALFFVVPRPQGDRPSRRPQLGESVRLVFRDPALLTMLVAVLALSLSADPVNTLTPGFVSDLFHRPDALVGVLVGAFGFGGVACALVAGRGSARPERLVPLMLLLLGGAMLAFALSPSMPVAIISLAIGGIGFLGANVTATTSIQLHVSDEQRGRVMALWSIAFVGIRPFGSLADGAVASGFGLRGAGVLMAVPALATAAILLVYTQRVAKRASYPYP